MKLQNLNEVPISVHHRVNGIIIVLFFTACIFSFSFDHLLHVALSESGLDKILSGDE